MSGVTWAVCRNQRSITVFCLDCREVLHQRALMVEALELKMAAEASHDCAGILAPPPPATDLFGFPMERAHG